MNSRRMSLLPRATLHSDSEQIRSWNPLDNMYVIFFFFIEGNLLEIRELTMHATFIINYMCMYDVSSEIS
jgi:hypothetical protein